MKNGISVTQHQSPAGFLFPKGKNYAKILLDDWIEKREHRGMFIPPLQLERPAF